MGTLSEESLSALNMQADLASTYGTIGTYNTNTHDTQNTQNTQNTHDLDQRATLRRTFLRDCELLLAQHLSTPPPSSLQQVGVICQYVIVIELHKRGLLIYIPYAKDQIWTFNLDYIYADWSFY
jgi:hypothetical protein